ncbi:Intracellular exo-alpha-L-arabinofuranosidase 2 [compost metagenome]
MEGGSLTATGSTLAGHSIDAHNTFARPDAVKPQPFESFQFEGGKLTVNLPAMSVTTLELAAKA